MPTETAKPLPRIEVTPFRQVEIPPTSRQRYISGLYALNLPAPEGTSGDWHDVFYSAPSARRTRQIQLGGSDWVNTNHIYNDFGIYEGRETVLAKGLELPEGMTEVWVANHFRATLDLIYRSLQKFDDVFGLESATTDWLDTPEQQQYELELAGMMLPHLSEERQVKLAAWIDAEAKRT